jgi:type IV secretion system protein TrbL
MDDLSIIDRFTETFSRYIDSGFGLVAGDVTHLSQILIAIDLTLAGLFWAWGQDDNVPAHLVRKVLYVGFFAYLIGNWKDLSGIVFQSFASLGLKASGSSMTAADLMRPGFVADQGFKAAHPLLIKAGELMGFTSFFENFVTIAVLLLAWAIVLLAFFLLAVQLFIAILEFKLTTLAGFVLVPFALFGRTAFLAERVLGHVISSGIKLMVLAIVVGIGSAVFGELIKPITGDIALAQAASLILGAIAVFGLAIFVPALAAGLIAGAPQLGAGAAITTAAGITAAGIGTAALAGSAVRGVGSAGRSAVRSAATMTGAAAASYEQAGLKGLAQAALAEPARRAARSATSPIADAYARGAAYGLRATSKQPDSGGPEGGNGGGPGTPSWAKSMARANQIRAAGFVAAQAVSSGDRPAQSSGPNLSDKS